jgi:hypothetical protein
LQVSPTRLDQLAGVHYELQIVDDHWYKVTEYARSIHHAGRHSETPLSEQG